MDSQLRDMNGIAKNFLEMPIIPTAKENVTREVSVQIRFPKSKKKRIRKKCEKRPENFRKEKREYVYIIGNSIVASDGVLKKMASLAMTA